jgi:hypothetical protein
VEYIGLVMKKTGDVKTKRATDKYTKYKLNTFNTIGGTWWWENKSKWKGKCHVKSL